MGNLFWLSPTMGHISSTQRISSCIVTPWIHPKVCFVCFVTPIASRSKRITVVTWFHWLIHKPIKSFIYYVQKTIKARYKFGTLTWIIPRYIFDDRQTDDKAKQRHCNKGSKKMCGENIFTSLSNHIREYFECICQLGIAS